MSSSRTIDAASSEQLCYIPCNFCNIVLAVSVPCSSMFDVVTVRCGRCSNLCPVNMAAAFQTIPSQNIQAPNCNTAPDRMIEVDSSASKHHKFPMEVPTRKITRGRTVDPSPEKRQRVPSAYNQFIKEEIQRLKANNPKISHKEAFSTAAKNWAHFPHIHFGLMLETNNQA